MKANYQEKWGCCLSSNFQFSFLKQYSSGQLRCLQYISLIPSLEPLQPKFKVTESTGTKAKGYSLWGANRLGQQTPQVVVVHPRRKGTGKVVPPQLHDAT